MTGGYDETTLRSLGQGMSAARLVSMLSLLQTTLSELPRSSNQRTDAELCLMRLANEELDGSAAGLAARIQRLEDALINGAGSANLVAEKPACEMPKKTAPVTEDTPPWEEEPVVPVEPKPEPKKEKPAPVQAAPIKREVSAPAAGGNSAFWSGLVAGLRGKIGFAEYPFLSNANLVQGVLEGDRLTVWVDSDMTKALLNKPAVTDEIAKAATARCAVPVSVAFKVGKAPAVPQSVQADPLDALDALLASSEQFDNIIVTE
jgi:DNA polymerase-3 subunit gamma/tau